MEWLRHRFELARGGDAHNVRPMEGLRGFAVFLVFLVHYVSAISPRLSPDSGMLMLAGPLHSIGNVGVDLFFVLSGYLIYGSLISRPQAFGSFMARRVQRIYPAFLAVLVLYLLLSVAMPSQSKLPPGVLQATVYIMANVLLLPGLLPIEPIITVAWSLSYEMFYYLVIPPLVAVWSLRTRSNLWRMGFFVALAVIAAPGLAILGHVRLLMFVAGILLHELIAGQRVPAPHSMVALVALCAALLVMLIPTGVGLGPVFKYGILAIGFVVLCLACFQAPFSWLARAFSWTPLRWLGNMSYSYYLLHGLAINALFFVLGKLLPNAVFGSWSFMVAMPLVFLTTLLPSAALFLCVERPYSLLPKGDSRPVAKSPSDGTMVR